MSLLKKNAPVIDKPSVGKTENLKVFAFRKTVGLLLLTFTFSILCSCSSTVSEQKSSKGKKDSSKNETTTENVSIESDDSIISDITEFFPDNQEVPEKGSVTYLSREDFREALSVFFPDGDDVPLGAEIREINWAEYEGELDGLKRMNCTYEIASPVNFAGFVGGIVHYLEFTDVESAQEYYYSEYHLSNYVGHYTLGKLGKGEFDFSESVASMVVDVEEHPFRYPMYGGSYLYANTVIEAYITFEHEDNKEIVALFLDTINYPRPADIKVSDFDDDSIPSLEDSGFSNALQQIDLENAIVRTGDSSEFILQANRQNEDFLYHQYEDREWANENYADILEFYCGGIILHQFEGSLKFCITDSTISTLVDVIDRDEGKIYYGGYFLYNNIIHYALTYSDDFKERMDVNAYLEAIDYPSP